VLVRLDYSAPTSPQNLDHLSLGLGCVVRFVETVRTNMPGHAREEMIKYCAAHPKSATATRRPQLFLRNGLWFALVEPSVKDGIVGIGSTVQGALRAFDNR
jgi:hypothetical protein